MTKGGRKWVYGVPQVLDLNEREAKLFESDRHFAVQVATVTPPASPGAPSTVEEPKPLRSRADRRKAEKEKETEKPKAVAPPPPPPAPEPDEDDEDEDDDEGDEGPAGEDGGAPQNTGSAPAAPLYSERVIKLAKTEPSAKASRTTLEQVAAILGISNDVIALAADKDALRTLVTKRQGEILAEVAAAEQG